MKQLNKQKLLYTMIGLPILVVFSFIILQLIDLSTQATKVHTEVHEWGKYSGINVKIQTETAKDYSLSISTPTTSSDYINDFIEDWVQTAKQNFLMRYEEFIDFTTDELVAHFNIQLDIEAVTDDIYNLIFTTYTYLGGANGESKTNVFTVDLNKDLVYDLTDLIKLDNQKSFKKFSETVDQSVNDSELIDVVDKKLLHDALTHYDLLEWSINEEILRLYFDEYEVAAGSAGIIRIDIPLIHLANLIETKAVEQLQLSAVTEQIEKDRQEAEAKRIAEEKKKAEEKRAAEKKKKAAKRKAEKKKAEKKRKSENKKKSTDGKYVALTFDDGPSESVTPQILEILKEYDASATFFMLGSQVDYYPNLAAEVAKQGHEVANHTHSHLDLTTVKKSVAEQEIARSRKIIEKATDQTVTYVRPPYGAYNDSTIHMITGRDESIVLWSVDPQDWGRRNPRTIANHVLDHVESGSIVLLHDIHQTTADALPAILQGLQDEGYSFVTVSELIEQQDMAAMPVIRGLP